MLTLSTTRGCGGSIKGAPEDFIVREIAVNGLTLHEVRGYSAADLGETESPEGKFTKFIMQKRDWDTINALIRIAKILGRGKKSVGYCGTKDRMSVSVQLASIFGVIPEQVLGLRLNGISINGAWRSSTGAEMGANLGNAFSATIKACTDAGAIGRTIEELDSKMPNYYDRQRFGIRLNNFGIGMRLLKGDFEGAAMKFLTDTKLEANPDSIDARLRLAEKRDFAQALDYFPRNLRNERSVIGYLSRYDNYANALRKLPRGILLMFVHSVQSLIFNAALQERIKEKDLDADVCCGSNFYGFPDIQSIAPKGDIPACALPGYETKKELVDEYVREAMDRLELTLEDFRIKGMPELGTKGSFRALLAPIKALSYEAAQGSARIDFSIPAGSYATVLLNEITKSDELSLGDITSDNKLRQRVT